MEDFNSIRKYERNGCRQILKGVKRCNESKQSEENREWIKRSIKYICQRMSVLEENTRKSLGNDVC